MVVARSPRRYLRFLFSRVESDIGHEHVEVHVSVIVAHTECHPRSDLLQVHSPRHRGELHVPRRGIVAKYVERAAVVGNPDVGVAVVVIVEEHHRMGLARGLARSVPKLVLEVRVVALEHLAGLRVFEEDRFSIQVPHYQLGAPHTRLLADLSKGQVAIVHVEHVDVARKARLTKIPEVVGHQIADI